MARAAAAADHWSRPCSRHWSCWRPVAGPRNRISIRWWYAPRRWCPSNGSIHCSTTCRNAPSTFSGRPPSPKPDSYRIAGRDRPSRASRPWASRSMPMPSAWNVATSRARRHAPESSPRCAFCSRRSRTLHLTRQPATRDSSITSSTLAPASVMAIPNYLPSIPPCSWPACCSSAVTSTRICPRRPRSAASPMSCTSA